METLLQCEVNAIQFKKLEAINLLIYKGTNIILMIKDNFRSLKTVNSTEMGSLIGSMKVGKLFMQI